MEFHGLTLDPFQENSIKAIDNNHSVVVSAPTGSGKTLIADYIIHKNKTNKRRIIYTAPIKALSNQKYKDFSEEFGADKVGLMTGDIVINPQAKILIMTTEIYRNMVVGHDKSIEDIAYVIFDEVHYINDIERGSIWEESIIYSDSKVRFLCLSATIPNAKQFSNWIEAIQHHTVETIVATRRNVPLKHSFYDYELGITTLEKIKEAKSIPRQHSRKKTKKGGRHFRPREPEPDHIELIKELGKDKLPCLFFSFSRKDCQNKAEQLAKENLFQKDSDIIKFVSDKLKTAPSDISRLRSTQIMKTTLAQGIGFHHAGLLPIIKEIVEELFGQGLIKVLYTTETFAVGINMPAKTVCFASLRKYDGISFRLLNTKEYFQIAGRAGRRGIDKEGSVVSMIFRPKFQYNQIKTLTDKDIEPIKSQFKLSVNTVLNLLQQHNEPEIENILRKSFFSYQKFGKQFLDFPAKVVLARYYSIKKKLDKLGFISSNKLTDKGLFASHIFANEISISEIFSTPFFESIDEYEILLILAALIYEPRENHKFKKSFTEEPFGSLVKKIKAHEYLKTDKQLLSIKTMTTVIQPIYNGKTFFDVLDLTNLQEGDLIRIYAQVLDRIGQIKKATTNHKVKSKMLNAEGVLKQALEGIYLLSE